MAVDTYNSYIKVPYTEAPTYIAHTEPSKTEGTATLLAADGKSFAISQTDGTLDVNGKKYQDNTAVAQAIATAKSEAEAHADTKANEALTQAKAYTDEKVAV